jgi:hypothetical protein
VEINYISTISRKKEKIMTITSIRWDKENWEEVKNEERIKQFFDPSYKATFHKNGDVRFEKKNKIRRERVFSPAGKSLSSRFFSLEREDLGQEIFDPHPDYYFVEENSTVQWGGFA